MARYTRIHHIDIPMLYSRISITVISRQRAQYACSMIRTILIPNQIYKTQNSVTRTATIDYTDGHIHDVPSSASWN